MRAADVLRSHWFLVGIVLVIVAAKAFPEVGVHGGVLRPEVTVKIVCVSLIFFVSGLSIKTKDLKQAVLQWRMHLLIQTFTFLLVPLLVQIVSPVITAAFNRNLLNGLLTLSCMPPPVSSAVILTKAVGGNEAAAIFNSALGSILGVFVTPALLLRMVGASASVSAASIVTQLALTVILPLILGQIVRNNFVQSRSLLSSSKCSIASQVSLLLIIYTTFCDAFASSDTEAWDSHTLLSIIFLVILLQVAGMWLLFTMTKSGLFSRHFSSKDGACVVFCGIHKSLTLGIPILRILYEDDPNLSIICLPLLVYHPMQIILGGLLVPRYKRYIERRHLYDVKLGSDFDIPSKAI